MVTQQGKFQFAIDRGGTFTDVFARCPNGKIRVLKLLSEDPQHYEDAPTEGIRRILKEFNTITGAGLIQEQMFMKKIELSQIKKQIKEFATFLPNAILTMHKNDLNLIHHFVGVLLQGEICGIANVTDKYNKAGVGGIYRLTATLNAYIGSMIEILQSYGGDILKYTGQNFVVSWKVLSDDCLFEILHEAVVCALVITQTLSNFDTEVNANLAVKLAISCGNLSFSIIGEGNLKEFIIVGDAITQATSARNIWNAGKVVIAPGAWSHMLQDRYEVTQSGDGFVKVSNVCYKPNEEDKKVYYDTKQIEVAKLIEKHFRHRSELNTKKSFQSNITDSQKTERFTRSLPHREEIMFALKYWIVDELRPFIIKNVQGQVDEGQPVQYLTETRDLTILYISVEFNPLPDHIYVNEVDDVYREISTVSLEVLGLTHKVYFIEKRITFLVLFGLRGVKHETESQNAIRSAYKIRSSLQNRQSIREIACSVTNGIVYCGVVGHPLRREFTVIGEAVNKAYNLVEQYPETVTCDFRTFKSSKLSSFYFELKSSKLKSLYYGVFEYNEIFEREDHENDMPPLIGRKHEVNFARTIITDSERASNYYGVCYHGPHKIGKTAVLLHIIQKFQNVSGYALASLELESTSTNAYFTVRSLYKQIYDTITQIGFTNLNHISSLTMDLMENYEEMHGLEHDLAILKYLLLNRFRTLIDICPTVTIILIVDNIEYIDLQSWEILEIAISEQKIRFISSGCFEEESTWDLHFKISLDDNIKLADLLPLAPKYIPALACQFLDAGAISHGLAKLLIKTCKGHPGHVETCLLRLLNNAGIKMILLEFNSDVLNMYYVSPKKYLRENHISEIVQAIDFSDNYKGSKKSELTLAAISLDLFDSYTPYQQMVIKTSAVLGHLFTRNLLLVALKYPSESNLAPVIKVLFEEEILDCGSRYAYGYKMEQSKNCCRCYFEDNPFDINPVLPRYAFCKIMHFRNKSIKEVAYNLLPGNQRIELHLLCTDILEYTPHQCPRCMRDATNTFINFYKYKDITEYCRNPNMFAMKGIISDDSDDMKDIIKRHVLQVENGTVISKNSDFVNMTKSRPRFDMVFCKCFQIMTLVYKELIYHSTCAGHFGKKIFFSMQYGLLLTMKYDYVNAIRVLTEAKEYCMMDAGLPKAQISESFRKLHVGKIEMGLAKSCIELRKITAAKNHLAIALRQYNIPSMSLYYKVYSKLLTRSFLVNSKNMKPNIYKNVMARYDMGTCLSYCAKLFMLEGKWNFAKLCSIYSIYLLRKVNLNVPILFDVYSSALELYVYSNDMHTCEKLQRYVIRDLQVNYANNITDYFYAISVLLNNVFYISCISGNILKALRLGYRAYDIHLKIYGDYGHLKILSWLMIMLIYNYRVRDCIDISRIIIQSSNKDYTNRIEYYSLALRFYMRTGFYIEPPENIVLFAEQYMENTEGDNYSWSELNFFALLHLYFMRTNKVQKAEEFHIPCEFNTSNIYQESIARTLCIVIECKFYHFLRSRRTQSAFLVEEEKELKRYLNMLKQNIKVFKIFQPTYYCLMAWYKKLTNKNGQANKFLDKALQIAESQNNVLYQCYVTHQRNCWSGNFSSDSTTTVRAADFCNAATFTMKQISQFMTPYPLE